MMGASSTGSVDLPPGFYFSPTDEELILHFLYSKASLPSHPNIIPDFDSSDLHLDPWQLNGKALSSGNQHYFFTQVKENNRSTENGYWKEIGVTKPIVTSSAADENKVGTKKYLVFFTLPQGTETSWVMEEFHISSSGGLINTSCGVTTTRPGRRNINHPDQSRSKWVLCRVYEKKRSSSQSQQEGYSDDYEDDSSGTELSWLDEVFMSLDDDDDDDLDETSMPA